MPVIRISDGTWERLKRWAVPLEDSPDDAVRKVLDAAEQRLSTPSTKAEESGPDTRVSPDRRKPLRRERTPGKAFYHAILETLVEVGGSGRAGDVLRIVGEKMKPFLTDADYRTYPSGTVVWNKTANFARLALKQRGLLETGSPHGLWEISRRGREVLQSGG